MTYKNLTAEHAEKLSVKELGHGFPQINTDKSFGIWRIHHVI
jgi:hypothetical protein